MKRFLTGLIVLLLSAVAFVGCNRAGSSSGSSAKTKASEKSAASEMAASDLKIAIVCDSAGQNDNGYNQSAVAGAKEMAEKYGCVYKVVEPTESIGDTLRTLAENGYNLIFSMVYDFDALIKGEAGTQPVASMYPETTFVIFNDTPNLDADGKIIHNNVISVLYNVNESSYLAGALSVLVNENASVLFGSGYHFTDPSKARALGFIGGTDSAGIKVFSVGYIEGAQKIASELGVTYNFYAKYDAGFADVATGSSVAGTYYDHGADVVYACSGTVGDGVTAKAKEEGKLAIQVDANKDDQQPGYVLTSVIKNTKVVVETFSEDMLNGTLDTVARDTTFNLASGSTSITDMATISNYISKTDAAQNKWKEIKAKIDDLNKQITAGTIVVTNMQNGDKFDESTCPNIIFK